MTDQAVGSWRLLVPRDVPFLYDLICTIDPRWWRFSKDGLDPHTMLEKIDAFAAGALVLDPRGRPVAAGLLADAGASRTATFEYFALPDVAAQQTASAFAGEIISAAFEGSRVRLLYHERFASDPELRGDTLPFWEDEVVFPEFALIDGTYESRTTSVLTQAALDAWRQTQDGDSPGEMP